VIDSPEHKPLSRDDRDEIAAVAAAAARRNRPTHLVVAAVVLLVGSLAMAGSAFLSRRAAARALDGATYESVYAAALMERIAELRRQNTGQGSTLGVNEPVGNMLTQLAEMASQSNLTVPAPAEQTRQIQSTPFSRREFAYAFTCSSIDDVFRWVRAVGERIPGTQVYSISLQPVPANRSWSVRLTFARVERTGR